MSLPTASSILLAVLLMGSSAFSSPLSLKNGMCVDLFAEPDYGLSALLNNKYEDGVSQYTGVDIFLGQVFEVRYRKDSSQSLLLRNLFLELRTLSKVDPSKEVEWGGLVFLFEDGTSLIVKYTSHNHLEIRGEDVYKEIMSSPLKNKIRKLVGVIDIHTHPDEGRLTYARFSTSDYDSYISLKKDLESASGNVIFYEAIVLPNCKECQNTHLHTSLDDLN